MKTFTPSEMETPKLHGLLLSAVAPRPIAFVSTMDENGNPNLAPFSFFNVFSANPPIAIFSPARRVRGNTTKHTLDNVETTKECVINLVSYDILHQMNLASCEYGDGVNEFEKAGLTAIESEAVKPFRVKESPVQFECKVREVIHLGAEGGAGNLVVSEVVRMHYHDDVFDENENPDPQKLDLMARMGQNWYCRAFGDAVFEIPKPGRVVGLGVDALPDTIRNSSILTGNDLGKLGMHPETPTEQEVSSFTSKASEFNSEEKLHEQIKLLLDSNNTEDAWKLILASESK